MAVFIEIVSGPNKGTLFQLEPGVIIGRAEGDILLNDPKVSSKHAQVQLDGNGQLVLIDMNSANGIWLGDIRVKKLTLSANTSFKMGDTTLKMVPIEAPALAAPVDIPEEKPAPPPLSWRTILANKLLVLSDDVKSRPRAIERFNPIIKLRFLTGIQAEKEMILSYGKRIAGAASLDIELQDNQAPTKAFELEPSLGGVTINVLAPGKVFLNSVAVESELLKDGDIIAVGKTQIKVTFL